MFLSLILMSLYCQGYLVNEAGMQNKTLHQSVPSRKPGLILNTLWYKGDLGTGCLHRFSLNLCSKEERTAATIWVSQTEDRNPTWVPFCSTNFYDLRSLVSSASSPNCVCHQGQVWYTELDRDVHFQKRLWCFARVNVWSVGQQEQRRLGLVRNV